MEVLSTVLFIFSIIFLILQIFFLVMSNITRDVEFIEPMWIMCILFWVCTIGHIICEGQVKKNKEVEIEATQSIEYPATDYTFDYKVIEYQGKKDTTYVITPKNIK